MDKDRAVQTINMAVIKERYPHITESILGEKEPTLEIGIDTTYGKKVLYAVKQGETFQLDTLYDTDELMKLWYENLPKIYYRTKILLFGFGNGMFVRKLLHETPEDVTIIVYEPSACIFSTVIKEFDIHDILESKRVTFLLADAMTRMKQEYFYELLDYSDIENFIMKPYLNYNRLFEKEYMEYMDVLQVVCSSINSAQDVIGRYGKIYYENTFSNFKYFIEGKALSSLFDQLPKDIPAIVVAAGPSLDKNVQQLKNAKGKAFIIAVDTALRPLIRNGIVPDICISIDGKKMAKHFSEDAANDIPLICYLFSHQEILKNHRAEKIFINDLNHHIQHFLSQKGMVLPIVASGGSVANDAFSIAQMLGFKTIVLVGQDLALTDNKTHSEATVIGERKWTPDMFSNLLEVEGIDGKSILTKPEYKLYCKWFEEQIVQHPDLKVIDATEGGAMIHGTLIQTLSDTILQECTQQVDISKMIQNSKDFFDDNTRRELIQYIKKIPQELTICLEDTREGIKCYNKMLDMVYGDKYHSKEFKRLFERASKIGDKLDETPVMDYIRNRIQIETTAMLRKIYQTEDNERAELIAGCEKGRDYLKLMETELEFVIPDTKKKVADL